jgi:hypothetical protein
LVPHTIFWDRRAGWRRLPWYATRRPFGDLATATTQTPLLALAWEMVAESSPDEPTFRHEALDPLCRHYDWLAAERDPDEDGLVSIIHPDESGLDDSPKYEPVFRWMTHDRPGYFWLVTRSARVGYRLTDILARWDEHVEDVLFNVAYAMSLQALSRLLGEAADGHYASLARTTERALLERCYDEGRGLFWDLAGSGERRVRVSTWSSLAPLSLPSLPADLGRRVVEEHLLDHRRYLAPVGVPSVSLEESSFTPGFDRFRCWRGPSWVNTAWWLVPAMRRLGYQREADRIVESLVSTVERFGFREYYDPFGRHGFGTRHFSWSTLLVDLV